MDLRYDTALVLISEKCRFWSDHIIGFNGKKFKPRCYNKALGDDLRKSLIEIDEICKSLLKTSREEK